MTRLRAASLVAVLLVLASAGCVQRDVKKEAVAAYLNEDIRTKGVDCPTVPRDDVEEGIVGARDALDLTVGPRAHLYVLYEDRVQVVDRGWNVAATWNVTVPGAGRIHTGPDWVAVAGTDVEGSPGIASRTLDGERIARRALDGIRGVAADPDGRILALRAGAPAAVLARNLTEVGTAGPSDAVEAGSCRDTTLWLSGDGRVVRTNASGQLGSAQAPEGTTHLAVGHDLVFLAGEGSDRNRLTVRTVDGSELLTLSNPGETAYGRYAVAHGLVYNLRGDAILGRPIPDFLMRPS